MECPRCGEDNLPGLPACMGCGLDLSAPRPEPVALVPRVQARNPLDRKPARIEPPKRDRVRLDARLTAIGPYLSATLWGLVPGLGAAWRRDLRLAAGLVGATALCLVVFVLAWTHPLQSLVVPGLLSVVGTSILSEQRARLGTRGIAHQVPGVFLALAACLAVLAVGNLGSELLFPRVRLLDAERLPGGHYLLREVSLAELRPGDLVAVGQRTAALNPFEGGAQVAPVIALPGQRVESDGQGEVLVDGEPPVVPALNLGEPRPTLVEAVPAGHVVLYQYDLSPVPADAIAGALYYRWLPRSSRGPVPWPPAPPGVPE